MQIILLKAFLPKEYRQFKKGIENEVTSVSDNRGKHLNKTSQESEYELFDVSPLVQRRFGYQKHIFVKRNTSLIPKNTQLLG